VKALAWTLLSAFVFGCGAALVSADDPEFLDTAAKLAKCRAEMRAAKDAGPDEAWGVYEACKKDSGL